MPSVIVTGTSKGIGYETALAFGRAGYKVFATMRNPSNAAAFRHRYANVEQTFGMKLNAT